MTDTVKLTAPLRYVPAGQVHPVEIPAGTEVEGRAAELAKATGIAEPIPEVPTGTAAGRRAKAAAAAPETK